MLQLEPKPLLNIRDAKMKPLTQNVSLTRLILSPPDKDSTDFKKTKITSQKLQSIKFGADAPDDEVQFSELKDKTKRYAKTKYNVAKAWIKKKSDQQSQDKKDAAIAAGAGVAAGVAAEATIGGASGGIFGGLVAAFTGYKVHKHNKENPTNPTP